MLRTIWRRLWVLGLPVLAGGLLWRELSTKPPLATPPPEAVLINTATATATTRPTATRTATFTPMPSPTPSTTPEPAASVATQWAVPTQTATLSPAAPAEGRRIPGQLSSLPAVVRLSADEKGRYILIDQATQTMHVYERWREIRSFAVSTGLPDPQTQTPAWSGKVGKYVGSFKAFGTYQDDGWYLFSRGGAILLHGAPYTLDEAGHRAYQDLEALGQRPASHGCIRLAPEDAAWLTTWRPLGVPVTITAWPFGEPGRESDYGEQGVG